MTSETIGTTLRAIAGWADLEKGAPAIAAAGRGVLYRSGEGAALLATVRGADAAPRLHPVNVGVVDGRLYVFLLDSGKRRDLVEDGRYALHGHQDPAAPTELSLRGRARQIPVGELWDRVARDWFFEVDETFWLFELQIETAILGERSADEWPPRYSRWSAAGRS
jgi:hypothetical protein